MSKQTIWQRLKAKGFSDIAVAAIMGNLEAESNCISNRIQGDFTKGYQRSAQYTAQVDAGNIDRHEFIYDGPGGGGYGLAQWTLQSRKAGLYDFAKKMGTSIGDEAMQIEWLCQELQLNEYKKVLETLKASPSIRECSDVILKIYERPADQSEAALRQRAEFGRAMYQELSKCEAEDPEGIPDDETIRITQEDFQNYTKALLVVKTLKDLITLIKEL